MPAASAVRRPPRVASSAKSDRRCSERIFSWWASSAVHDWRIIPDPFFGPSGAARPRCPMLLCSSPAFLGAPAPVAWYLVPQADDRLRQVVLVPHRTEAGRSEHEVLARPRLQPEPACGEHPEKVSAGEEQHVTSDGPHTLRHPIGPRSDLIRRFPSWAAVAEQLPAGALDVDLGAGAAFVRAVVPFVQVRVDFRRLS